MKILTFSPIILCALFLCQCTSDDNSQDSSSSCEPRPTSCIKSENQVYGTIEIKVDINELNPEVELEVYEGTIGTKLVFSDKIRSNRTLRLNCGTSYSAKTTYLYSTKDGRIASITAYDEEELDANAQSYCEGNCYSAPRMATVLDLHLQTALLPDSIRARWNYRSF